mgnify:CR=1 FL=1
MPVKYLIKLNLHYFLDYPHIKLPYKEKIFTIERLVVEKIDFFINKYEKESK